MPLFYRQALGLSSKCGHEKKKPFQEMPWQMRSEYNNETPNTLGYITIETNAPRGTANEERQRAAEKRFGEH
jgi:hypothetical protein